LPICNQRAGKQASVGAAKLPAEAASVVAAAPFTEAAEADSVAVVVAGEVAAVAGVRT